MNNRKATIWLLIVVVLMSTLVFLAAPSLSETGSKSSFFTIDQLFASVRGAPAAAVKSYGLTIMGSDGTYGRLVKTTSDGTLVTSGTITVTGVATAANQTTEIGHLATLAGGVSGGHYQVDVLASALPTDAATATLQTSGNASLTTIAGKDFATQTTLAAMSGKFAAGTVIGAVQIDQTTPGTTNKVTVGSDVVHTIVDSGTITAVTGITNALPAGSNIIGAVKIDQTTPGTTNKVTVGADVVHTIVDSGAITANIGTAGTLALETGGNLATIAGKDFATQTTLAALNAKFVTGTDIGDVDVLSSALPTGASTSANQTTEIGHLATLAGGVSGGHYQIDVIASALPTDAATQTTLAAIDAGIPAGLGNTNMAASMPITVASDDTIMVAIKTAVEILDNAISGSEMQVDVVGALPAGANNIGDVDVVGITNALPAGDNNIGNVDIATAIPAGDNNIGNVDLVTFPAANLGQQAMAASLSVVPANNITDATYIGDIKFGESLPAGVNNIGDVDVLSLPVGTAAMAASTPVTIATDDTMITALDAAVDAMSAKITACNTGAVVISSGTVTAVTAITNALPAGTNNIGHVEIVDASGNAFAQASDNSMQVGAARGNEAAVASGAAGAGLTIIASAGAGKKTRLFRITLSSDTTTTLTLNDGMGVYYVTAGMPFTMDVNPVGIEQGTADTAITCTSGVAANVTAVSVYYHAP